MKLHLDFPELKKKSEGTGRTQSFLVAIDECTRMVAAKPGKEGINNVVALLEREMFRNTKCVVSDNGAAFTSKRFRSWAEQKGITLKTSSPYHPSGNGLAERVIRDLKQYMSMY
ncbi:DDE-type integrase/transposase/recombinase, partial [Bradyrhizobium sp. 33ap4]|uniref:DDE-type integrase/transposase/recombinase n=1 Tax=Bradyrhizobium sp. 33ap4 TaxID=3061630 RepID=UPI003977A2C3